MHQSIKPVGRGNRGRVNAQRGAVGGAHHDFFAPVAEDVAAEVGRGLGAIIGRHTAHAEQGRGVAARGHPFGDRRPVEQFAQRIGIPPGAEVHRRARRRGDGHAFDGVNHGAVGRPGLVAGVTRVDIEGHAASDVAATGRAPERRAVALLGEAGAVDAVGGRTLVRHEKLQARTVRIHFRKVCRVTVAEAGAPESGAVVVNGAGAVGDLIFAVPVQIADADAVGALAGVGAIGGRTAAAVEGPALGQLPATPVPRSQKGAGVIATGKHAGGALAVQVGDGGEKPVEAVAVAVAPKGGEARTRGVVIEVVGVALGKETGGGEFGAGESVKDRQELGTGEDVAAGIAVIVGIVEGRTHPALPLGRAADVGSGGVERTGRAPAHDLGAAIPVEIVNHEIHVMRARADIHPEIDAPDRSRRSGIEFVGVQVGVSGVAALGVVLGVGRIPLENELVFAVTIEIAHTAIVGGVGVGTAGIGAAGRDLQGDGEVLADRTVCREGKGGARGLLDAAKHGADGVGVTDRKGGGAIGVIGRRGQRRRVEFHGGGTVGRAVEIKCDASGIISEQTPANVDLGARGADRNHAATERLHLPLGKDRR